MRAESAKQIERIKSLNYDYRDRWAETAIGTNTCAYESVKVVNYDNLFVK